MELRSYSRRTWPIFVAVLALVMQFQPFAWGYDGSVGPAKISMIDSVNNTYGFRVYLNVPVCGTTRWGYIDTSDLNYNVSVATLLSAKATNSTVYLYSNFSDPVNKYCHIVYINVLND